MSTSGLDTTAHTTGRPHFDVTVRAAARTVTRPKLTVEHFSVTYAAFLAISDISLAIADRRITAIIGPSGCGKSTLLRSMNRMNDLLPDVRTQGTIRLDGKNIYDPDVDVVLLRQRIGMVFQQPNPFAMSIVDNVAYGLRREHLPHRTLEARVEASLRRTALWDEVKDRLYRSALALSGGQQQRLCIARAIAVEPDVLLLDEPTSALDPIAMHTIEELMLDLSKDYTIVIVTHNMQQAARVADFTAFLLMDEQRTGQLIEFGPTQQIFTAPHNRRTEEYITGKFG